MPLKPTHFCSAILTGLLLFVALSSCRSPDPIWNDDGRTMTDLRTLRLRNRPAVMLTPGVMLYADRIDYADKRKRAGTAVGRVYLEVEPEARYFWMVEHGYAGSATFDLGAERVILAEMPMLEREKMTMIATAHFTTMHLVWDGPMTTVHVAGPTRTDFAKSHPIPPGGLPRGTSVPPPLALKPPGKVLFSR